MPFATLKGTITFQNYFFPLGFSGITLIKYKRTKLQVIVA